MTIEVWYDDVEEPQRITAYPFESFYLMRTFDNQWVAVTFEARQLLVNDSDLRN